MLQQRPFRGKVSHQSPLKGVQCLVRGGRGHGLETFLHRDQGRTRCGERLLRWPLGGIPVAGGLLEFKTDFFESSTQFLDIDRLNILPRRRDRFHHRRYLSQQCQAFLLVRRQHGGETFDPIDYRQGRKLGFFALQFCERIGRAERIPRRTVRFLQEPVFPRH